MNYHTLKNDFTAKIQGAHKFVQNIFKALDSISQNHEADISDGLVPADIEGELTEHNRWKGGDWTRIAGTTTRTEEKYLVLVIDGHLLLKGYVAK